MSALAALGRTDEIELVITESHVLEYVPAPVRLMSTVANEFHAHGPLETARSYGERALLGVQGWSDSLQRTVMASPASALDRGRGRAFHPGGHASDHGAGKEALGNDQQFARAAQD